MRILVDASNTVLRNMYSKKSIQCVDADGNDITGAANAIIEVATMAARNVTKDVIACFDRGPYIKAEAVKEFKADRKKNELSKEDRDSRFHNLKTFETLCKLAGFTVWAVQGYEADDLLAMAVPNEGDCIIIANDSDLFQLYAVNKGIEFCTPGKYLNYRDFARKFPVKPEELPLYLSITGTHNGLRGIKGKGPAAAKKLFEDDAKLNAFYKEHKSEIDRQIEAIYLPYNSEYFPVPKRQQRADVDALEQFLYDGGIILDVDIQDHLR